ILFDQRKINVPFENFQHRIKRLRGWAGYSAGRFWGFVKFVRLHDRILKPLPVARNARFKIESCLIRVYRCASVVSRVWLQLCLVLPRSVRRSAPLTGLRAPEECEEGSRNDSGGRAASRRFRRGA